MILFIDATGFDLLHFALISGDVAAGKKYKVKYPQNEQALGYLDRFLKSKKVKPAHIKKIIVASGQGSFTGIRVGFAIGSAFALATGARLYSIDKKNVPAKLADIEKAGIKKV